MKYNPDLHHRHSIRLKEYDYSTSGFYYVTICTQDRERLFGEIVGADSISAQMKLNHAGKMIETILHQTIDDINNAKLDKYVIMPNHFHCIVGVEKAIEPRADMESAPTLGTIIQAFKRNTTIKYISGVKTGIYPPFNKRIWQRNYYERIIRNEREYQEIWKYIDENPARWTEDEFYR